MIKVSNLKLKPSYKDNDLKIAIAKKMFSLNLPTSQIMQITGLTEEEINNLT